MHEELEALGRRAKAAGYCLEKLSAEEKNRALRKAADALVNEREKLLSANARDLENARQTGMPAGLLDRLTLTKERIEGMAEGLRQVAALQDPVGEVLETISRPNGLLIQKYSVPFGVIGIIYESRPNVTADAFALCFKTGNAVILKGGKEAFYSNAAITQVLREVIAACGITPDAVQMITDMDRAATQALMKLNAYVDVLIPRGGAGLIRAVVENSTVPVIETGTGNCHIYIDKEADPEKAIPIVLNAKTQRIGVCNACESLVIHSQAASRLLPALGDALRQKQVELRCDARSLPYMTGAVPATEEDFVTEYLDQILSVKTVDSLEEAICHINRCNTGHSETIVTEKEENARRFLREVDAACVYWNASTRFTDGFEFGFGAEIGISTQKLHARGPMGLKELTSYKYIITGSGQIRP